MMNNHKAQPLIILLLSTLLNSVSVSADSVEGSRIPMQLATEADHAATRQQANGILEILPEDFRPAFTRATVIRLNGIVERSYQVISELDQLRRERSGTPTSASFTLAESEEHLANRQRARIASIRVRSKAALDDMNAAVAQLKASEEYYNSAVLAGMIMFVNDVEQEVSRFDQNG